MQLRLQSVRRPRRQRGMSLVELMVGVVIGLIIVAAATVMAATQLTENRKLLLDTQVQQDMRASMDIMTRELRRSGHFPIPGTLWSPATPNVDPTENVMTGPVITPPDRIDFQYQRPPTSGVASRFAYYLDSGVIYSHAFPDPPASPVPREPLTDSNALVVTRLVFERQPAAPGAPLVEHLTCPKLCAGNTENCWPTFQTYEITITMEAQSASDPNVQRTLVSRVRPRNDATRRDPAATQMCPP